MSLALRIANRITLIVIGLVAALALTLAFASAAAAQTDDENGEDTGIFEEENDEEAPDDDATEDEAPDDDATEDDDVDDGAEQDNDLAEDDEVDAPAGPVDAGFGGTAGGSAGVLPFALLGALAATVLAAIALRPVRRARNR